MLKIQSSKGEIRFLATAVFHYNEEPLRGEGGEMEEKVEKRFGKGISKQRGL